MVTPAQSIQRLLYPSLTCFGCGQASVGGLHLESFNVPEGIVAAFTPQPVHDNGSKFVNGGILATILDCHSGAVCIWSAFEKGLFTRGEMPSYVTSGIDVRYVRPAPLGPPLELWGEIEVVSEAELIARAEVRYEGKVRTTARATWKRFTPRK